jgi:catechol 2,3-dioxygenase-like lactoylglutathione lyase family enzyme
MEVATIDHVNVETDELERSAKFYREVIGLKEGPRPDFDRPGFWMYAGEKPVVHIIKTDPNNKMLTGSKDASISHFALQIKDFQTSKDHLDALGVKYDLLEVPETKVRQIFLEDPEGVLIELIYLPDGKRF